MISVTLSIIKDKEFKGVFEDRFRASNYFDRFDEQR